ncbi:hypothetical protein DFA_04692 [Cavenderia fasciculata]|uniref:Kelch repeat-containing protein n=1 Tax=Cavenderia fasciculata TaxID=261658 RepID=F4PQ99_CACFS|nr:uncharacterized protein DFA_04692 [Cavenderia fasciculata]EGG22562.1 hypothetical protein DFA_04692 [Cavenderia fasciculata]|eukprot:XP_004360413.1 hypothetical protein DFA_04692 [Cavenderia fasciculata]
MWYQVTVEGGQPQSRINHASTFLHKQSLANGSCPSTANEIGRVVVYGGRSSPNSPNTPPLSDLAFMSIGIGCTDEIAKPQNKHSQNKLNKLLGGNNNNNNNNSNSSAGASSSSSLIQNNNINSSLPNPNPNPSSLTSTSSTSSFTSSSTSSSAASTSFSTLKRKTYSKLPVYNGNILYHWENSLAHGEENSGVGSPRGPSDRMNHSLLALNLGTHKGKIIMFGGVDSAGTCYNDLYILDAEMLWWENIKNAIGSTPPSPRHSHYSCQISNDTILIYGGINENKEYLNDIYTCSLTNQNLLKWNQIYSTGSIPKLKENDQIIYCSNALWVVKDDGDIYKMDIANFRWNAVSYKGTSPVLDNGYTSITSYATYLIILVESELENNNNNNINNNNNNY